MLLACPGLLSDLIKPGLLPPLILQDFFSNKRALFPKCWGEPERLKALPDRDQMRSMLMLPDENEDIFLSPMGNVLRQRFIHETEEAELVNWPPEVAIGNVDEKIAFSLLKSKHHPIKDILPNCHKLAEIPFIRQVIGGHFENTALSRIKRHDADGTIYLLWADDEKAQNIIIQTTSQGKPQTLKVVNKIREVLEI